MSCYNKRRREDWIAIFAVFIVAFIIVIGVFL